VERQKRAYRVEVQRQRREADGTKITDQEQKEADDAEDDYYLSEEWARLKVMRSARHQAICNLAVQARHESGTQDIDTTIEVIVDNDYTGRVIIKNDKHEVVYIMSNEGHPTQWVSVNPWAHGTEASARRRHKAPTTTTLSRGTTNPGRGARAGTRGRHRLTPTHPTRAGPPDSQRQTSTPPKHTSRTHHTHTSHTHTRRTPGKRQRGPYTH
jgi:hypothetical protein